MNSGQDGMPPPEELISVRRATRGRAVVLTVEGDVDVATASVLRRAVDEALTEAGPHPLVIDLTGVTFLASRGLSTLVEAHREASASSPLRVVVDHTRPVIRPLQLSGLDRILTLFHDVEDALSGRPEVDVSE
ncbi:STAS domain-containing protein [Pseudonocardia sp. CA-142604]|uniref:STAS domain-containing protein n=1 Tax=Pseudonocardia sp. CA-142604 TaxID=3240024 RepID=UPI003D8AF21A